MKVFKQEKAIEKLTVEQLIKGGWRHFENDGTVYSVVEVYGTFSVEPRCCEGGVIVYNHNMSRLTVASKGLFVSRVEPILNYHLI